MYVTISEFAIYYAVCLLSTYYMLLGISFFLDISLTR